MKATRFVFPIIIVLAILIPFSLSAQNTRFYLTLKPGLYSPQSDDLEDFDPGFSGEIILGRMFNKNFSAELGIGYFNTKAHERTIGGPIITYYAIDEHQELTVIPVTIGLNGIYPIEKWEIYALAGIGLYFVSGEFSMQETFMDYSASASMQDSDTIFGAHLGLGIRYNISPKWFIGGETKYLSTSKAKLEGDFDGNPAQVKLNLNGFCGSAFIGLRF